MKVQVLIKVEISNINIDDVMKDFGSLIENAEKLVK